MDYKKKYLKYKSKYLMLSTQMGGNMDIFNLYLKYFSKMVLEDNFYLTASIFYDYERLSIQTEDGVLMKKELSNLIQLDYTPAEISRNFDYYGVLILRNPLKSKKLLIGCGSKPIINYKDHEHYDYVTINPELSMNPTIVGSLGYDSGIIKFMKDNNHKFDTIVGEGVTLYSDNESALIGVDH